MFGKVIYIVLVDVNGSRIDFVNYFIVIVLCIYVVLERSYDICICWRKCWGVKGGYWVGKCEVFVVIDVDCVVGLFVEVKIEWNWN